MNRYLYVRLRNACLRSSNMSSFEPYRACVPLCVGGQNIQTAETNIQNGVKRMLQGSFIVTRYPCSSSNMVMVSFRLLGCMVAEAI